MHMLWNTQIINTCIIFPSWHISSTTSFVFSFIVIVLLGVLYEHLRCVQQRLDVYIARRILAKDRGKRASSRSRSGSASPVGVSRADEDREPLLAGRFKVFTTSPGDG
jgi:copper transporter 1